MSGDEVAVTFVASSGELGGAELYLDSLLGQLGGAWIRTVVVPAEGELAELLRAAGHPVEVVPIGRRVGLAAAAIRLRRAFAAHGASVIHAHGSKAAVAGALATRWRGPRLIWVRVDRTLDGVGGRLLASRCDQLVGASRTVTEPLEGRPRRGAHVVYPGVPEYRFDRAAARRAVVETLGCRADADLIIVSGRLTPAKGQLELIEAAPRLIARRPRSRIALLGGETHDYPGYERVLRERARALGIEDRVSFLGHRGPLITSVSDAVRFVAGCDVLVAPSVRESTYGWEEGFGLAAVEAMSVSTPVVAYRNGSLPEVLGECGIVVAERDREALAVAIGDLLADPDRRRAVGSCGARRAAAQFRRADAVAAMKERYRASAEPPA